jgi:hypothetical protein
MQFPPSRKHFVLYCGESMVKSQFEGAGVVHEVGPPLPRHVGLTGVQGS